MRDPCASYLKQVGQKLRCPKAEKARLLAGLEAEIADAFPVLEGLSLADVSARFGPPSAMATELQNALPDETMERYLKQQRTRIRAGLTACIVTILVLLGYLSFLLRHDMYISPANQEITNVNYYIVED